MAKARALVRRRKAVSNIRKITRTMQLIATARYQQAFKRAAGTKPYTEKIRELVGRLSAEAGEVEHPLLRVNEGADRQVLLVITSNRGLCGGYNASVQRGAIAHHRQQRDADRKVDLHVVGRKGINYFRFLKYEMAQQYRDMGDQPAFADVEKLAERLMALYAAKEIDAVDVAYMRFRSASQQEATVLRLLPLSGVGSSEESSGAGRSLDEYDFSPDPELLLAELLPQTVKVQLFQCFNDAVVSEQVARMIAMKSATDAAGDMIKSLTQQYNRARQTQITTELLEVIAGAEALVEA